MALKGLDVLTRSELPGAVLIDVDGTLVAGGQQLPGADQLIQLAGSRAVLVSNDAEHTPVELSRNLGRLGLSVAPDRIVLAGTAMLDTIRREYGVARILLLGSASLAAYARDIGLVPVNRDPAVVAVARDRTFDYAGLAAAANSVRGGAALIAANPDRTHPGAGGMVVPETGALLAAILACVGPVVPLIVGKSEPALFLEALARLGAEPEQALMIGDNVETDGCGASALGMRFYNAATGLEPVLALLRATAEPGETWIERRVGRG